MRRFLATLAVIVLTLAIPSTAGTDTNGGTTWLSGAVGSNLSNTPPFTVAAWVKGTTTSGNQSILTSNGWGMDFTDSSDCSAGQYVFVKFSVFGVCSTISTVANAWQFVAVTVSSTQVHFFIMSASGSVTTSTIADSRTITGTAVPVLGAKAAGGGDVFSGILANIGFWSGVSLSDAELTAYAWHGPHAVGKAINAFWPLYFPLSPTVIMGNYTANQRNISVFTAHAALLKEHCPCADAMGPIH